MLIRGMLENFQATQAIAGTSEDGQTSFPVRSTLPAMPWASAGLSVGMGSSPNSSSTP